MKRIAIVIGTRPEAIKLAPVAVALRAFPGIDVRIIATGQHRSLLDQALVEVGLAADIDLDLMTPAQSLPDFAGRCLVALGRVFEDEAPDYVIAQGDTSTALAAAHAAYLARIPFGHVEAGLRSGDPDRPFPEEKNRKLVSLLARHHFCPTERGRTNLLAEGIAAEAVHVTGNTVIDTLLSVASEMAEPPPSPSILVTVHRTENIAALPAIAGAVLALLDRYPDLVLRWPIHPNPRLGDTIRDALGSNPRADLTGSLPYRAFVAAMRDARLILTDSGGVQEEAAALGTPLLVLRDETERPEGVAAGAARLVGNDPAIIVAAATALLDRETSPTSTTAPQSPYGDGNAGRRIADIVTRYLAGS
jgi:UDP-N-acetylglucosamine 2-epimerase (non-hydrolysing)